MVFSSYTFILFFLPIAIAGYYIIGKFCIKLQSVFLVLASLFFYGYFNPPYIAIILGSILFNYIIAKNMSKNDKLGGYNLLLGIIFNILLLGYYKYYDFFIKNINSICGKSYELLHILLPLGISFFTFQQLSFLISVYKKEETIDSFVDYTLFVTFFPQLVAGPIVLYSEMIPQFRDKARRCFNSKNFAIGVSIFIGGLFKKAVIADSLSLFVDNGFAMDNIGFLASWFTSISYTLQIYFDFSGYSEMAIGLAKMFNIDLPKNFSLPYQSSSINVFWRRWHMTLGRALSTYVYFPLGGNRNGHYRTYCNLFITFFISGIWHGAAWTFIIWGCLHGLFMILERYVEFEKANLPLLIKRIYTFVVVNLLWVLFRADSFESAIRVYTGMVDLRNISFNQIGGLSKGLDIGFPNFVLVLYVCLFLLISLVFVLSLEKDLDFDVVPSFNKLFTTLFMLMVSLICISRESIFIYFNF